MKQLAFYYVGLQTGARHKFVIDNPDQAAVDHYLACWRYIQAGKAKRRLGIHGAYQVIPSVSKAGTFFLEPAGVRTIRVEEIDDLPKPEQGNLLGDAA